MQIFDKAQLAITAVAVPQTVPDAASSVDVRVAVMLPDGEGAATNVAPAVPSVSFSQAGGPGGAVINTTPSCIITPASADSLDCQPLTAFPLAPGEQLHYTFRFDKIVGTTGPVWFSVSATGLDGSGAAVSSGTVQTYAVAVDGVPASLPPTVTAAFDPANGPQSNDWFNTQPVLVNLVAALDPADGVVQQIEYNFGPTPPEEGAYNVCFNVFSADDPDDPSCVVPIFKGGTTTMWYRALSSRGIYDTLVPYGPDPTVLVPGWNSIDINLDFTEPIVHYSWTIPLQNGWFNQVPATANFSVTDGESLLDSVTVGVTGADPSVSFSPTSNVPAMAGSVTFGQEGVGTVTVTATDRAGNVIATDGIFGIDVTPPSVDPPVISGSPLVASGGATWSSAPITATFTGHDALSGFGAAGAASTTCVATVAAGLNVTANCNLTDRAGNSTSGSAGPFSIDTAAPGFTATPPPGGVLVGVTRWYPGTAAPTAVDFLFDDGAGSGFGSGSTIAVSAPIVGQTAAASQSDLVGNTTNAVAGPFAVDGSAPTIVVTLPPPDATSAGIPWYRGPLNIRFDANDNGGAGFAGGQSIQEFVQSGGEVITRTHTDLVGNSAIASAGPFNMDLDGPVVTISYEKLDGTPLTGVSLGGSTWFNGPFKVRFTATDAGVGFSHPVVQLTTFQLLTVSSSGPVSATFTDLLGHTTSVSAGPFSFDVTPPAFTFTTSPAGVLAGSTLWYQTPPSTVTFVGDDGPTGTGFGGGAQTSSVTVPVVDNMAGTLFTDQVGNSTLAVAGPFSLDANAPTVTATPAAPDTLVGLTGWYGQPVSVIFSANDNGGAGFIDSLGETTQTAQSTALSTGEAVTGSFTDLVGNTGSASAGPFNIDTAGPVVGTAITHADGSPATGVTLGGTTWFASAVNVTLTATDAGVGFSAAASQPTETDTTLVNGAPQSVSHTFTDLLGYSTSASIGPFAIDAMAPILTTADVIVGADSPAANPTAAFVSYVVTATDNVDPSPAVTCSPASGFSFAFGDTTVTCTATDAVGHESTQSFIVTVEDRTDPVLTVPAAVTQVVSGPTALNFAATATDNLDSSPAVLCTPPSGSVFPLGSTTVSCTATDASGNSTTDTFSVTLASTPPTITVPASFSVEAVGPGGAVATYAASATDVIDGALPVSCTPASGSTFPLGGTTVTCTATNSGLLTATASFQVSVIDTLPPVLTAPDVSAVATAPTGTAVVFAVAAQDIVDGATVPVTCSPTSGSLFPIGATPVICQATDGHGNTGTASFNVTVLHSAPVCSAAAASPGGLWPPNHRFRDDRHHRRHQCRRHTGGAHDREHLPG